MKIKSTTTLAIFTLLIFSVQLQAMEEESKNFIRIVSDDQLEETEIKDIENKFNETYEKLGFNYLALTMSAKFIDAANSLSLCRVDFKKVDNVITLKVKKAQSNQNNITYSYAFIGDVPGGANSYLYQLNQSGNELAIRDLFEAQYEIFRTKNIINADSSGKFTFTKTEENDGYRSYWSRADEDVKCERTLRFEKRETMRLPMQPKLISKAKSDNCNQELTIDEFFQKMNSYQPPRFEVIRRMIHNAEEQYTKIFLKFKYSNFIISLDFDTEIPEEEKFFTIYFPTHFSFEDDNHKTVQYPALYIITIMNNGYVYVEIDSYYKIADRIFPSGVALYRADLNYFRGLDIFKAIEKNYNNSEKTKEAIQKLLKNGSS